jgi:hypothetical protein
MFFRPSPEVMLTMFFGQKPVLTPVLVASGFSRKAA